MYQSENIKTGFNRLEGMYMCLLLSKYRFILHYKAY